MLNIIDNPNVIKYFKMFVSNDILAFNPVIAGGLPAAFMYKIWKDKNYLESLEFFVRRNNISEVENLNTKITKEFTLIHGDTDLWFLKDNIYLADKNSDLNKILKKEVEDKDVLPFNIGNSINNGDHKLLKGGYLSSSSYWATTFSKMSFGKIQFIKKIQNSIEELLKSFDINNCKIAYYDNKIYYCDSAKESFLKNEISINEEYLKNASFSKRSMTLSRIFKYSKRYALEPTREAIEFGVAVYYDLFLFKKNGINPVQNEEDILQQRLAKVDPYGVVHVLTQKNLDIAASVMHQNVDLFIRSKNFNEFDLIYFAAAPGEYYTIIKNRMNELSKK